MPALEREVVSSASIPLAHSPNPLGNDLTLRTNNFINHWLLTGNGTESARIAGFPGDNNSLAAAASRLLRSVKVSNEIKRRLGKHIASADEVLETLTNHARSDIAEVLESDGTFNLTNAKRRGVSRLLKKLKVKTRYEKDSEGNMTPVTEHEFELYDAQAAAVHIGKAHGIFIDKTQQELSLTDSDAEKIGQQVVASLLEAAARKRLASPVDSTVAASSPSDPA